MVSQLLRSSPARPHQLPQQSTELLAAFAASLWRARQRCLTASPGKILLVLEIRVRGDQDLVPFAFSRIEQPAIAQFRPSFFVRVETLCRVSNFLRGSGTPWSNSTRIYAGAKALRAACSRTARTCSSVTPGNHSTNCDAEAPSSRFSKSAATGIRVPRNTQAPLTRSGFRSTSVQDDQSIMPQ
jgi:hypothetical protein